MVKFIKEIPMNNIIEVYNVSKSHTEASRLLSQKFGFTSRAWRYKLRGMEEKGIIDYKILPNNKLRDTDALEKAMEQNKVTEPEKVSKKEEERMKKKPEDYVMLTVHFKIDYKKIGAKGFHPFYLEGFMSKKVRRDFSSQDIYNIMNSVQDRLNEFGALVGYLELMKQEYEQGVEVEELDETRKREGEFKYDYKRKEGQVSV